MEAIARDYVPECLTIFPNNGCNLACSYCHSEPDAELGPRVSDVAVRTAADVVASACAERGMVMTFALLGGGEPLVDVADARRLVGLVRDAAGRRGVGLRTYVGTNGVLPDSTAEWAAGEFDLVGISCDGPPVIQDLQRCGRDRSAQSASVERTALVLRRAGTPLHIRATVTRHTLGRQREVVSYAATKLGAEEVRLEPEYSIGRGEGLGAESAREFVAHFLEACAEGDRHGVPVTTSLYDEERGGRFCNVLRGVLCLASGDFVTGCFLDSRIGDASGRGVRLGHVDGSGRLVLDRETIVSLAKRCALVPEECHDCTAKASCSYGCPDLCVLRAREQDTPLRDSFRCRALRMLAEEVCAA